MPVHRAKNFKKHFFISKKPRQDSTCQKREERKGSILPVIDDGRSSLRKDDINVWLLKSILVVLIYCTSMQIQTIKENILAM
jgi:hypothetical protein